MIANLAAFKDKNVLITGGLGFIGSNLAMMLHELGARVSIIDLEMAEGGTNLNNIDAIRDKVTLCYGDIRDRESFSKLRESFDHVFALAAQVSHIGSMRQPQDDLQINALGHLNTLEFVREHAPDATVIFTSTRQVYGRPERLPVSETHAINPPDVNAVSKFSAEQFSNLYHQCYRLKTVNLRLTNTYGPRMDLRNPDRGFMSVFLRKAICGEKIEVFGTGQQQRDFNYVDDVVHALLLSALTPTLWGETLNLGHGRPRSIDDIVQVLLKYADFSYERIDFPEDRHQIDIGSYCGDFTRFTKHTGWQPEVEMEEGLARTIKFFKHDIDRYL